MIRKSTYNNNIESHNKVLDYIDYEDSIIISRIKDMTLEAIKVYYLYQDHTAKETCEYFRIEFSHEIAKVLFKLFPKSKGLGGARKGSGKKKHTNNKN